MEKQAYKRKQTGQVFTPDYLVEDMLDYCGYAGQGIIGKHVVDNSCGNGAFLSAIVKRYVESCKAANMDEVQIKSGLEQYVHGMEIDHDTCLDCRARLDLLAEEYGITAVQWDVRNIDSLLDESLYFKMDYVVGNPPYVRVHNLNDSYSDVKRFAFANGGMTDLYLAFYEMGFKMLRDGGTLCYITPGSWLNSLAAANMRRYVLNKKNIVAFIDLGHFQPFDNATAYTLIGIFRKGQDKGHFAYYVYDEDKKRKFVDELGYGDICIDGKFYLSKKEILHNLKNIKENCSCRYVQVKNGFATLADKVFISGKMPYSANVIPVIKASTGKWYECFFPYDRTGKPLPLQKAFDTEDIRDYMESRKQDLLKGKAEHDGWYLFGRTQALADVFRFKVSVNTIVKGIGSLKISAVPEGCGLYSGLYVLCPEEWQEKIRKALQTDEFINYVACLKNYKSGGYYTFNSKDLEQYLNYWIEKNEEKFILPEIQEYGQFELFKGYKTVV